MDDALLSAFGFAQPGGLVKALTLGALRFRALLLRALPERRRPRLRTQLGHRTYPEGYTIEQLGPPPG